MSKSDWQICAQTHDRLGESILWHPTEAALYWIDFYGPLVHRIKQAKGAVETWKIDAGKAIGSLVFADEGRLILALDNGLYLFDTATGKTVPFADPKQGRTDLGYNDGKVDRSGRYWVGTYDIAEVAPNGAFYRVAGNGAAVVADEGFVVCNGPTFSPDTRKLYFSDSVGRQILSYDLDRDGNLSSRQSFCIFSADDGLPDGLAVDSAGNVWCALYGGGKVVCLDTQGALKLTLPLPTANVTSLCFGGPGLKTLHVTTGWSAGTTEETKKHDLGGSVFMRTVDIAGLPEPLMNLSGRSSRG
jgi:sugar lactone lactonase YvrE